MSYYIGGNFEKVKYDYETSKDPKTADYCIRKNIQEKNKLENFMGRFGIGEVLSNEHGYTIRVKRQVLFQKMDTEIFFKPTILNFRMGSSGGRITYH